MSTQLLEPILKNGIQNTHYFNGRLLTAEALRTDQEANRQQHQQLGQAIGAGVVYGLDVEELTLASSAPGSPSSLVKVSSGLALNREGQGLYLPNDTEVSLVTQAPPPDSQAGLFAECDPGATTTATGVSAYILVLTPASGFRERAPMSGLGGNGKVTGCGSRYAVEGVKFRLLRLNLTLSVSDTVLQNVIAHLCFGAAELPGFYRDAFERVSGESPYNTYGVLDSLSTLTDCDVPLALIYWGDDEIEFVDMWAVRRRVTQLSPSPIWPVFVSERRLAEAEAVFLQFHEQLDALIQSSPNQAAIASIEAGDHFRYLPPAGLLPVNEGGSGGLDRTTFFTGIPHPDPTFIDGAQVQALFKDSLNYEPIDLSNPSGREMVWLYKVRENEEAISGGEVQPYIIFATGHMPPIGAPRFDLARWNYSNFV